jgi:cytoskeletal protein RodZ
MSISIETSTSLPAPDTHDDTSSINVGMVVGVVVGVLAATVLCALLYWWMWKKRRVRVKVVDSGASSRSEQEASAQTVALQRIQGVVRRPDTSTSEVPPPYHEAVRSGNTP